MMIIISIIVIIIAGNVRDSPCNFKISFLFMISTSPARQLTLFDLDFCL